MVPHHQKVKSQLKATLRVDLINRTRHQERQAICTLQLRPRAALGAEPGLNVEPVRLRELSIIALNARGRLTSVLRFIALKAVDLIVLRKRSGACRLGGPFHEQRERLLATLGIMISADHLQPPAQSTLIRLNLLPSFVQVVHDLTIHIATSGVQGAVSI